MTSYYMLVVRDLSFGKPVVERAEKAMADYATANNYGNELSKRAATDKLNNFKQLVVGGVKICKQAYAIATKYPELGINFEAQNAMHPAPVRIYDKTKLSAGEAGYSVQQFLRFDMARAQPTKETGRFDLASLVKTAERVPDPNMKILTDLPQFKANIAQSLGFLANYKGAMKKFVATNKEDGARFVSELGHLRDALIKAIRDLST